MALKAVINSLEDVPESVKGEYVPGSDELEGKFVLNVTGVDGLQLAPVTKLQNALTAARQERDSFKDQLKAFKDDEGNLLDVSSIQSEIEELRKLKDLDSKDGERLKTLEENLKKQFATREAQLAEKFNKDLEKESSRVRGLKNQLHQSTLVAEATKAIEEHNGYSEVLLPHIERFCKAQEVESEDGSFQIKYNVIDPATGQPRLTNSKPGSTDNMSISELVGELKENPVFQGCFKAGNTSGSDSGIRKPNTGNQPLPNQGGGNDAPINPTDKLRQARATS